MDPIRHLRSELERGISRAWEGLTEGWRARMRATYHRKHGTEQFFGFYDVHADCLDGLFRKRKRLPELFEAFERLRHCYPYRILGWTMGFEPTTTGITIRAA